MTRAARNDKDITERLEQIRQQLENAEKLNDQLQEKLTKYESAANGANDGLWDWDFTQNESFVSIPWKTMLGIDPDAKVDMEIWQQLIHPEDKEGCIKEYESFIEGEKQEFNEEFRMLHVDGTYRWIHSKAKAVRDNKGRALRVSGSHTDITDRRIAAEAVARSEAKYRTLFQNSLVAMFRMKLDTGEIIDANDKLKHMLERDSIIGCSFYDFMNSKVDRKAFDNHFSDASGVENIELQLLTDKSNVLWVSFSGANYERENEVDCVLKDITQTKENFMELQKVNFELDSFVYHASHDLRSPLRSVLGLIDLYRMEEDPRIKAECIEKIESSVKRLDLLVMDLLSISRNDRVNEPRKEINLMNEVNSSITSYYNASNTKNLEIITRIKQPVQLISDLTRIRIILNNLISNAIKYRSFAKERSHIIIDISVDEKQAVIKIEDNGEGIEESKLPHIFDMFYRATEKSEGSGLGLYIVKKVADKLNATIEVNSVELEGTTFTVIIPNSINE